MTLFKAYTNGFKEAVKLPRPVFLIWLFNIIIAGIVAVPLFSAVDGEIGHSVASETLLRGFDANVWSDMIPEIKSSIAVMFAQIKWIIVLYWLLSIFFAGGIIRTLNQDKFTIREFFGGSADNFFRFWGISIIMLFIQFMVLIIIWLPAIAIMAGITNDGTTETLYIRGAIIAGIIHLIVILILFMVGDYAKFYAALYDSKKIFKSVGKGFSYVFNNFGRTFGLYIILLIIPFAVLFGFYYVDARINTTFKTGVIVMFIIQQIFILLRIWTRVWIFASPLQMYTEDFLKDQNILKSLAVMNEWQKKAKAQQKSVSEEEKSKPKVTILTEEEILERLSKEYANERESQQEYIDESYQENQIQEIPLDVPVNLSDIVDENPDKEIIEINTEAEVRADENEVQKIDNPENDIIQEEPAQIEKMQNIEVQMIDSQEDMSVDTDTENSEENQENTEPEIITDKTEREQNQNENDVREVDNPENETIREEPSQIEKMQENSEDISFNTSENLTSNIEKTEAENEWDRIIDEFDNDI